MHLDRAQELFYLIENEIKGNWPQNLDNIHFITSDSKWLVFELKLHPDSRDYRKGSYRPKCCITFEDYQNYLLGLC